MRFILICATLVFAIFVSDARTDALASWCASYQVGGNNCGFATQAQCLTTVHGIGGTCNEMPDTGPAKVKSTRVRRERPVRNQEVVSEAPAVDIGISIGFGGGSRGGHHHKGSKPFDTNLTNVKPTLPPGFQ